ncbi:hypothetical protein ABQ039_011900 [Xanthomonas sp. WHRI 6108]|jgi:hypothetical protein|uniref:hypothetical protein n=1 Tax=Xanthomonas TaxID=338 RepID=UPI001607BD07|nr:hypothetical protein [Xanthomonas arboricola]MBB5673729.1 hypothetical protein [Xanthomonas arboricola]
MKIAVMGRKSSNVFNHVRYEARSGVHAQGGFKAGYRLNDDVWSWSATKFDDVNQAHEAAVKLAREAISMGERGPEEDPVS